MRWNGHNAIANGWLPKVAIVAVAIRQIMTVAIVMAVVGIADAAVDVAAIKVSTRIHRLVFCLSIKLRPHVHFAVVRGLECAW